MKDIFRLQQNGTNLKTEIVAGITTFMTMSYILFVNPSILGDAGMDRNAVLLATAVSSGLTTILMGLWANYPFALAPGMGLNAYFAYSVCRAMNIPWQTALGAIFIEGVIFLLISILPVREKIISSIPMNIKLAISVGIGLFIAFIGLEQAGIVARSQSTIVAMGNVASPRVFVAFIGVLVTGVLMARRVKGSILFGILLTAALGLFISDGQGGTLTKLPQKIVGLPSFDMFSRTFFRLDIKSAMNIGFSTIIFTFIFVDLFDNVGTVIGLTAKLNLIDPVKGTFPRIGKVLCTDSIGAILGSFCGTSTVTSYIESASGVAEGGRTGLTAVTTGLLFLVAIFFWPLASVIPQQATAPALIIVGFLMMEPILKIDLTNTAEALPAFLTIMLMPLTYSIANGLIFGFISFTALKVLAGKHREISFLMYFLTFIFIVYFFIK